MSRARHKHKAKGGAVMSPDSDADDHPGMPGLAVIIGMHPHKGMMKAAGEKTKPRMDRMMPSKLKDGGSAKWIAGAVKHKGALHRALGVPAGEKIPAKKLAKAEKSDNPRIKREANLAKTLKGFHH